MIHTQKTIYNPQIFDKPSLKQTKVILIKHLRK